MIQQDLERKDIEKVKRDEAVPGGLQTIQQYSKAAISMAMSKNPHQYSSMTSLQQSSQNSSSIITASCNTAAVTGASGQAASH